MSVCTEVFSDTPGKVIGGLKGRIVVTMQKRSWEDTERMKNKKTNEAGQWRKTLNPQHSGVRNR